jgi:hypothetical protein
MSESVPSEVKKKKVSYSQYSKWFKCPNSWKLDYLDGLRKFEGSVNTCFGTAIHEALQLYIETLYTKSHVEADSLKLYDTFKTVFDRELANGVSNGELKYSEDEYTEFCFDAEDILAEFTKPVNRLKNFPSKKYEFIGAELPLEIDVKNNVQFTAFIDLVLKDKATGKYKIIDFKTSSSGWNSYMKEDESKYSQLLLYKAFYSRKFNVPLEHIEVEFFILKRKLLENVSYPQNRLQLFTPANNKAEVVETIKGFTDFIDSCFEKSGEFKKDGSFPKIPGKAKKNCKYCVHKKVTCDAKED